MNVSFVGKKGPFCSIIGLETGPKWGFLAEIGPRHPQNRPRAPSYCTIVAIFANETEGFAGVNVSFVNKRGLKTASKHRFWPKIGGNSPQNPKIERKSPGIGSSGKPPEPPKTGQIAQKLEFLCSFLKLDLECMSFSCMHKPNLPA